MTSLFWEGRKVNPDSPTTGAPIADLSYVYLSPNSCPVDLLPSPPWVVYDLGQCGGLVKSMDSEARLAGWQSQLPHGEVIRSQGSYLTSPGLSFHDGDDHNNSN